MLPFTWQLALAAILILQVANIRNSVNAAPPGRPLYRPDIFTLGGKGLGRFGVEGVPLKPKMHHDLTEAANRGFAQMGIPARVYAYEINLDGYGRAARVVKNMLHDRFDANDLLLLRKGTVAHIYAFNLPSTSGLEDLIDTTGPGTARMAVLSVSNDIRKTTKAIHLNGFFGVMNVDQHFSDHIRGADGIGQPISHSLSSILDGKVRGL